MGVECIATFLLNLSIFQDTWGSRGMEVEDDWREVSLWASIEQLAPPSERDEVGFSCSQIFAQR
jgi:hypothetical protein